MLRIASADHGDERRLELAIDSPRTLDGSIRRCLRVAGRVGVQDQRPAASRSVTTRKVVRTSVEVVRYPVAPGPRPSRWTLDDAP